jgi:hypothetical protein
VTARPHPFPSEVLIGQEEAGYGRCGEDPEVSPEQRNVDSAGGSEQEEGDQQDKPECLGDDRP